MLFSCKWLTYKQFKKVNMHSENLFQPFVSKRLSAFLLLNYIYSLCFNLFKGCATTSSFYGNGELSVWKVAKTNEEYRSAFANL